MNTIGVGQKLEAEVKRKSDIGHTCGQLQAFMRTSFDVSIKCVLVIHVISDGLQPLNEFVYSRSQRHPTHEGMKQKYS